jgi:hypothetical protein
MASWSEFEAAAPELAEVVRRRLDAHTHKTIATIRRDGAEEVTDPERVQEVNGEAAASGPSHLFRLDLREVSTVGLNDERNALVIRVWTPDRGVRTIRRA